jgi:hypothetical protein
MLSEYFDSSTEQVIGPALQALHCPFWTQKTIRSRGVRGDESRPLCTGMEGLRWEMIEMREMMSNDESKSLTATSQFHGIPWYLWYKITGQGWSGMVKDGGRQRLCEKRTLHEMFFPDQATELSDGHPETQPTSEVMSELLPRGPKLAIQKRVNKCC